MIGLFYVDHAGTPDEFVSTDCTKVNINLHKTVSFTIIVGVRLYERHMSCVIHIYNLRKHKIICVYEF